MEPDSRFPDRPTHPDFDLISQIAIDEDNAAQFQDSFGDIKTVVGRYIDADTLSYFVRKRALIGIVALMQAKIEVDLTSAVTAALMDGFCIGAEFERRKHAE